MDKIFRIGTFCFGITNVEDILIPANFLLFEISDGVPEFIYHLNVTNNLPLPGNKILASRDDLTIYKTMDGEERFIGMKGLNPHYAYYRETSNREAEIFVTRTGITALQYDTVFTSLFALERQMIRRQSLILHCAYVEYQGKAILFSAPSGTGKSTQAGLWEKYRESSTVNGDRALLRKADGTWMACGWPVCGSSEICKLGDTAIHAIVMLRQGKRNSVMRLSPIEAFRQLYPQVTVNQWSSEFVQAAMNGIEDLIMQIPVWQLTCDMTEEAVQCLEGALFPDSTVKL